MFVSVHISGVYICVYVSVSVYISLWSICVLISVTVPVCSSLCVYIC